ncbi:AMP-binding protein [Pararhizobium haloflavum]|uniref:AMP-binding protein n=1 Tax=Pararhizobium haloflavum TaxID=2037914 RepID=UPI0018E4CED2|nr:AMP-binding protein [Pararhizobium haloflavum]
MESPDPRAQEDASEDQRPNARFCSDLSRFDDQPALIEDGQTITYRRLADLQQCWSERLGARRSLVFLEARNHTSAIAAYLGCLKGGHVVHLFGEDERDKLAERVELFRPNVVLSFNAGRLEEDHPHRVTHALHPQLQVLLSTSGSTGAPKLVKLSDRNISSNALSIAEYLQLAAGERAVTSLRFNYSYGMSVVNSHIATGGTLVLTERSAAEAAFWTLLRAHAGTSFAGVPYVYERLRLAGFSWADAPSLRYATQAGGRLPPDMVRHFADLGERHGWRFYVMYGQTEASPRMAYLPPEMAAAHPDCIGIPIPGGQIALIDETGRDIEAPDVAGELVYRGPNVMMGYAVGPADLGTDCSAGQLRTGDVACRNADGLFCIVGRTARFVKPFGIRINLDQIEHLLAPELPGIVCAGDDRRIVIALPANGHDAPVDSAALTTRLAEHHGLPDFVFEIVRLREIPRLSTGKVDYRAVMEAAGSASQRSADFPGLMSGTFLREIGREMARIVGFQESQWSGVEQIYATLVGQGATGASTFTDLNGDSLVYVETHMALEEYLGSVPPRWEQMSVDELEEMRSHAARI